MARGQQAQEGNVRGEDGGGASFACCSLKMRAREDKRGTGSVAEDSSQQAEGEQLKCRPRMYVQFKRRSHLEEFLSSAVLPLPQGNTESSWMTLEVFAETQPTGHSAFLVRGYIN